MATISFHNGGGLARRDHNIRNPKTVENQPHINPDGEFEIWHDEKPREAYERLFGDAVADYNARQPRKERHIKSYYSHIKNDARKHTVYEVVISVGSKQNPVPNETCRTILREFYDGWNERNPNLEVIGAYLHYTDEEGVPHVHLDYVPVATGYKNGMYKQNGLVKAYGQMGFIKEGKRTAQIQWEARECAELERICNKHGVLVEHPTAEMRKHLATAEYKARMELESTKKKLSDTTHDLVDAKRDAGKARQAAASAKAEVNELRAKYASAAKSHNQLVSRYNALLATVKKLGIKIDEQMKANIRELQRE